MGDRTTVTLSVPKARIEEVCKIVGFELGEEEAWGEGDYTEGPKGILNVILEEVNYGNVPNLDKLVQAGIPYISRWEAGGSYTAGQAWAMYSPEGVLLTGECTDEEQNPDLYRVKSLSEDLPDDHPLRVFLAEFEAKFIEPSWEGQEEYSRLYRATQLIAPSHTTETN